MSILDDKIIIGLFFERSEEAIVALSEKYGALCRKVADNILGNRLDSEECVNDTYLGVWNTIPPQTPDPLVSFVCKIVRNLALKKYHANTAAKRNSVYDVSLDELENCFPSADTVEDSFNAGETALIIDEFLRTLDKQSRTMFIRRYWCADPVADIAKSLGVSSHSVSVKLSRIRERLRKHLIKKGVAV